MATRQRALRIVAPWLGAAVLWTSCGGEDDPREDPAPLPRFAVPGADDPSPSPANASADRRPAARIVDDLLERAHGRRRGGYDRVAVEYRDPAGDPRAQPLVEMHVAFPDRYRIRFADGLVCGSAGSGDVAWQLDASGSETELSADAADRVTAWLRRTKALTLWPLAHADDVARVADDSIELALPEGTWCLRWDPDQRAPVDLRSRGPALRFESFYKTVHSQVPVRVSEDGAAWLVRIVDTDIDYVPGFFVRPSAARAALDGAGTIHGEVGGSVETATAGAATLREVEAVSWLLHRDPGDWRSRMALYASDGRLLGPKGYGNGGNPLFLHADDGLRFVIPFRSYRDDAEPVEAATGDEIRELEAHRVLQVLAGPGADLEARVVAARAVLDAAFTEQGLTATGPLRVEVNLVNHDPVEDPASLQKLRIVVARQIAD